MNQVDRRKSHPPRQPLPCRARADERDNGASSTAVAAQNQFKCCVCDDYSSIVAQRRNLVDLARVTQPTPLHRLVEPVPVQTAQHRRNDDVEIAADRLVGRVPRNVGHRVVPLPDDPLAIDGYCHALPLARPLRGVHILNTAQTGDRFT